MSEFAQEPVSAEPPVEGADAGTETDEGAAPAFDFEAPETRDALASVVRDEFASLLEAAARYEEQPEGEEGAELDPYGDPSGFRQMIESVIDSRMQQRIDPMLPTVQAFEDQQNEQRIDEWCEHIPAISEAQGMLGSEHKENAAGAAVRAMATSYLPDLEARYGPGERAVQGALRMAADQYAGDIKAAHQAGYQARNAELRGYSNAPAPAPSAVESVGLREEPADELAAAGIWASRNGLRD